jgi:outer membrane protein TolC
MGMRKALWAMTAILAGFGWAAPAAAAEPLTIEQARELVRQNNFGLRIARERLVQAEALIDKSWVGYKPQLNATGTYTHTEPSASLAFPEFESIFNNLIFNPTEDPAICGGEMACIDWENVEVSKTQIIKQDSVAFSASLYQPLFNARAYNAIKQAYTGHDLAAINTDNLEEYMLHSLDVAYYSALTARKYVAAAEKAVELRRAHLEIARAKFEVGDQPKITVLRAEIDLNQAEQDVRTTENSLALAKEGLALLMARDADFELVEPEPVEQPAASLGEFIERALAKRRDLRIAELNLELAERDKQDAWFRFIPTLGLTGSFRASDTKGFTGEYYTWNVGLALSIPLYDGGLRYAELDEARSRIRESRLALEQTRHNIRSEIRQLWLNMESAQANLIKARKALTLAEEQAELAKISFEAGAITNLEVLDANHMVFLSEVNAAQLELQYQLAILKLEKAVRMFNPAGGTGGGSAMPGGNGGMNAAGGASGVSSAAGSAGAAMGGAGATGGMGGAGGSGQMGGGQMGF